MRAKKWWQLDTWDRVPSIYMLQKTLISQMIKGCKEKFFSFRIVFFVFVKDTTKWLQVNESRGQISPKKNCILELLRQWKKISLQPFIIWRINMIPRILIFATINKKHYLQSPPLLILYKLEQFSRLNFCYLFYIARKYKWSHLTMSRVSWILDWTEPRRSEPSLMSSLVRRMWSQSWRSSLCT